MDTSENGVTTAKKFSVVAKVVWDNLPFENPHFAPNDLAECEDRLKNLVRNKAMGQELFNKIFGCALKGQPIYLTYSKRGIWTFLTMKSGTR